MLYYVFGYDQYYPLGGANDFLSVALSIEQALEIAANRDCDNWHITDHHMTIIKSGSNGLYGRGAK